MGLYYMLHSGKNVKFIYYFKGILRCGIPKFITRALLPRLLKQARQRPDYEYMMDRVNYYNKLNDIHTLPEDTPTLADHSFKKQSFTGVYFYDTYQYTRYFPNNRKWDYLPDDITYVPEIPKVLKSRPIAGNNENSVVLNLDKVRHFIYVKDKIPFTDKSDLVIFRGKIDVKVHRQRFMNMYLHHPMCDLGDVSRDAPKEWKVPKMTIKDHLKYKFIMALEGNDVASNLKWVMSSNSLAVMPKPTYETWFMEGRLIPNYHYVEIKADYSDLEERLKYYIAHPDEAQSIINNANEYVKQFKDKKREKLISLLVLEKYFQYTK